MPHSDVTHILRRLISCSQRHEKYWWSKNMRKILVKNINDTVQHYHLYFYENIAGSAFIQP